jgi:cob(I)alamin adenosyltransferase
MKLSTKKGDDGYTDLGKARVPKNDPRVEALGTLDELDAFLADAQSGLSVTDSPSDTLSLPEILEELQKELAEKIMPIAAGFEPADCEDPDNFLQKGTAQLEDWIGMLEQKHPIRGFVQWTELSGDRCGALKLNIARTICRRAERRVAEAEMGNLLPYVNRLSDLLFLLAVAAGS